MSAILYYVLHKVIRLRKLILVNDPNCGAPVYEERSLLTFLALMVTPRMAHDPISACHQGKVPPSCLEWKAYWGLPGSAVSGEAS